MLWLPSRLPGKTFKPDRPILNLRHRSAHGLEAAYEFSLYERRLGLDKILDYSPHQRHLSINGSPTYRTEFEKGPGYAELDGSTDYFSSSDSTLGNIINSAEWTCAFWWKQEGNATGKAVVVWEDASTPTIVFLFYPQDNTNFTSGWRMHWQETGPAVLFSTDEPVPRTLRTYEWYSCVLRSTSYTSLEVYMDGRTHYTETADRSGADPFDTFFVSYSSAYGAQWPGQLASLRLWSRALTLNEVDEFHADPWAMYYTEGDMGALDLGVDAGGIVPFIHHYKQAASL